jgi:hypothetical protein
MVAFIYNTQRQTEFMLKEVGVVVSLAACTWKGTEGVLGEW